MIFAGLLRMRLIMDAASLELAIRECSAAGFAS
jgi:hypothetical protein